MRSISVLIAGILFLLAAWTDAAGQGQDPLSPRPQEAKLAAAAAQRQEPVPSPDQQTKPAVVDTGATGKLL
jgi:hypothetical protein